MKKIIFTLLPLFISCFVLADLSSFPDSMVKAQTFNGYIAVGKAGSSTDVISQSIIGLSIASYIGAPQTHVNKLDNEVSLKSNLILIGNPCVNILTKELLENPEPCDRDFPSGQAFIRFYEKAGIQYIVVAGYSDRGTKKAAERLADFLKQPMKGAEVALDVAGEEKAVKKAQEEPKVEIKEEKPEQKEEPKEEPEQEALPEEKPVIIAEAKYENIFVRLWIWLKGLFA